MASHDEFLLRKATPEGFVPSLNRTDMAASWPRSSQYISTEICAINGCHSAKYDSVKNGMKLHGARTSGSNELLDCSSAWAAASDEMFPTCDEQEHKCLNKVALLIKEFSQHLSRTC